MLKKTITYTDYNGVKKTEDFYFNLTNAEIAEVAQSNNEYSANLVQLINKISKIKTGEQHPSDADKGSLLPIEDIIPITPEPLEDVTEYEQHSNWFDKICNWLKNLFGG